MACTPEFGNSCIMIHCISGGGELIVALNMRDRPCKGTTRLYWSCAHAVCDVPFPGPLNEDAAVDLHNGGAALAVNILKPLYKTLARRWSAVLGFTCEGGDLFNDANFGTSRCLQLGHKVHCDVELGVILWLPLVWGATGLTPHVRKRLTRR
jgi:hypothetical protein